LYIIAQNRQKHKGNFRKGAGRSIFRLFDDCRRGSAAARFLLFGGHFLLPFYQKDGKLTLSDSVRRRTRAGILNMEMK
jgi:hypothetical protein